MSEIGSGPESPRVSEPESKKRVPMILGIIVFVVIISLLLLSQLSGSRDTTAISGKVKVIDPTMCHPAKRFAFGPHSPVLLKNKSGKELDKTQLDEGTPGNNPQSCTWAFTIHVPKGEELYVVSIGGIRDLKYTWDEINQPGVLDFVAKDDNPESP